MIVYLHGNSDNSGNIDKFVRHKVSQIKAVRLRQRECVTHPLLLDSEIHDGVRIGWDLARNPLNYVNAWVGQRSCLEATCLDRFATIVARASTTVAVSHFPLNQINRFGKGAATTVAVLEFSITVTP
jgi:hypothetical protein